VVEEDVEALGAGPYVDEGEAGSEVVGAGADDAAGDGDAEGGVAVAALFDAAEVAEVADGAVLRLLTDDAGVDDGEVGVLRPGGRLPAETGEAGGELVGIGLVHLAALGPDVVAHREDDCSTAVGTTHEGV
jgi:hypothetical protein